MGDASRLMEWGFCVMSLTEGMLVQGLEINGASGFAILFRAYYHAVAPCDGRANGHLLQHTETNILVEACFNLVLPVCRYGDGCVVGDWCRVLIKHKA